ncbi:hypothetical protein BDR03DRAFT_974320, partial [Suillus americanus]
MGDVMREVSVYFVDLSLLPKLHVAFLHRRHLQHENHVPGVRQGRNRVPCARRLYEDIYPKNGKEKCNDSMACLWD